jgi:leucyl-tRNA synthetase
MPQWAGSCWYYLRYLDPHNDSTLAAKDKLEYWMPVDLYVGGAEHAVLHLLYSRFWHKVLYDIGVVNTDEPFMRLVNQGMILGEGGVKMSKSLGNVINPDDVIQSYGADAMRMYEMFMGPLEVSKPWSTTGIAGIKRFLDRVWRLSEQSISDREPPQELLKVLHQTIRKVSQDTATLQFNTAIAQMMIFITEAGKHDILYRSIWQPFVMLLAPYAPHLGEELWEKLGNEPSVAYQRYPDWDEELAKEDTVTVVFQINGKIRAREELPTGLSAAQLESNALEHPRIRELLAGKKPDKVIAVVDKLVNLVVRSG